MLFTLYVRGRGEGVPGRFSTPHYSGQRHSAFPAGWKLARCPPSSLARQARTVDPFVPDNAGRCSHLRTWATRSAGILDFLVSRHGVKPQWHIAVQSCTMLHYMYDPWQRRAI